MMKIGIIGKGVVGTANGFAFEKLGHDVIYHDPKLLETGIASVAFTDLNFICVPTPQSEDGSCNTTIVEQVLEDLRNCKYKGVTVIKSTVPPGFTDRMMDKYGASVAVSLEFLRERCSIFDATENVKLLPVGTFGARQGFGANYVDVAFDKIVEAHGDYPKSVMRMKPIEVELLKYMHNCFNALRIGFANEFYEIANSVGADYNTVKKGLLKTAEIPNMYLDVTPKFKGFAGVCLPKDLAAMIALAEEKGVNVRILKALQELNLSLKPSVFPGMRLS